MLPLKTQHKHLQRHTETSDRRRLVKACESYRNFWCGYKNDISILWKLFSLTETCYWSYSKTPQHFVLMCAQTWFACPLQRRRAKACDRWQLPKWFVAVEWGESQLFMISITVYLGKCQEGYCCVKTEHTRRRNAIDRLQPRFTGEVSEMQLPRFQTSLTGEWDVFRKITRNISAMLHCICKWAMLIKY